MQQPTTDDSKGAGTFRKAHQRRQMRREAERLRSAASPSTLVSIGGTALDGLGSATPSLMSDQRQKNPSDQRQLGINNEGECQLVTFGSTLHRPLNPSTLKKASHKVGKSNGVVSGTPLDNSDNSTLNNNNENKNSDASSGSEGGYGSSSNGCTPSCVTATSSSAVFSMCGADMETTPPGQAMAILPHTRGQRPSVALMAALEGALCRVPSASAAADGVRCATTDSPSKFFPQAPTPTSTSLKGTLKRAAITEVEAHTSTLQTKIGGGDAEEKASNTVESEGILTATSASPGAGGRRLYSFDEIPPHLQDNKFIRNYYRAFLTAPECVQSVFEIHNETGNIWTHLIGLFLYVGMWYWVQRDVVVPKPDGSEFVHRVMFTILALSMMVCLGASAMFHTMLAHKEVWVFKIAHALDYAGATSLMTGTFIPLVFYSFVCSHTLQAGYITMACVLGIAGVVAPLIPWFEHEEAFFARLGIYASIAASVFVPAVHLWFATPVNEVTAPIYMGIVSIFVIGGAAVAVYASNFPERFAPGRFDLWLHSHQIWHALIFCGCIVQFFNVVALYQNWSIMQGRC